MGKPRGNFREALYDQEVYLELVNFIKESYVM